MWCLPTYLADKFLNMIKAGTISPDKMIDMTSEQRRNFFSEHFGEVNAVQLNTLLESKLILKNQQTGMVTWAKKVAGITPEAQRGLVNRVNKMSEVLTPETEDVFLKDLAAHVLGTTVTMEEAGNITTLAKEVADKDELYDREKAVDEEGKPTKARMDYGRTLVTFDNYVSSVKAIAEHETISERVVEYLHNPFKFIGDLAKGIAATSREMRTTLDNSWIGKQGRNLFFKGITGDFQSGKIWWDTFKKSYKVIWDTFRGVPVMDEIRAEILSDPEYDMMKKAKVATAVIEEEAPTDWYKNIPYLGKPFLASHNAFTASAHYARYKTAKYYFNIARKSDIDLNDKVELESIGKLVNSLTARGEIGAKRQAPGLISNIFFSPRMLKADLDVLTMHKFDKNMSKFAKKEAAKNLLHIVVAQGLILGIAYALWPETVEWDPHSSDFGKIKIGNTRFDISGGTAALTRLAVRLVPLLVNKDSYIKSTSTGKLIKLNTGKFGELTGVDILEDYLENKTAPAANLVLAHLAGHYKYRKDEKISLKGDIRELFEPLPIQNFYELINDENSANILLSIIADEHGLFVNTYSPVKKGKKIEIKEIIMD
uniref:Uncharacterized protein n=1 Tax=viral metagenome TaxID=1070528 RepID=A0A6M3KC25_9ZZZZ